MISERNSLQKMLFIDAEKCTGCRICEIVCAFHHEREAIPSKSRVRVLKWEEEGVVIPLMCLHCEEPLCEINCPVDAIHRDENSGAVLINNDKCIKCKMCVFACPFGLISFDLQNKTIIKCDLCEGDPLCAKLCPWGAITYETPTKAMIMRSRNAVKHLGEIMMRTHTPQITKKFKTLT